MEVASGAATAVRLDGREVVDGVVADDGGVIVVVTRTADPVAAQLVQNQDPRVGFDLIGCRPVVLTCGPYLTVFADDQAPVLSR